MIRLIDCLRKTFYKTEAFGFLSLRIIPSTRALLPVIAASFLWTSCDNNAGFAGSGSKKTTENQTIRKSGDQTSSNQSGKDENQTNTAKNPSTPKDTKGKSDPNTNPDLSRDGEATGEPRPDDLSSTPGQGPGSKLEVPEACNPTTGATFANLLTPTITLGAPTSEIVYEISSTDCEGKLKLIKAESIAFDFDGVLNRSLDNSTQLRYRLVAEGTSYTGILEEKIGEDLFGNKGDKYYYFQTTQKVSTSTTSKTIRLAISVAGKAIQPRDTPGPGQLPGAVVAEFTLKSFLRFGATAPVTKPITFKVGGLP